MEEKREYFMPNPGRIDDKGIEWWRTDGVDTWYRWEGSQLITNDYPTWPTDDSTKCDLCGFTIDPHNEHTWKQVAGWVGGPKKDSMRLRHDTGKYAHDDCIHKALRGQAPDQPSLFDEE